MESTSPNRPRRRKKEISPEELARIESDQAYGEELLRNADFANTETLEQLTATCSKILQIVRYSGELALYQILDRVTDPYLRKMVVLIPNGVRPAFLKLIAEEHRRQVNLYLNRGDIARKHWSRVIIVTLFLDAYVEKVNHVHFTETVEQFLEPSWLPKLLKEAA